jgi:SH3 domain-containing YSC84-like protein 1
MLIPAAATAQTESNAARRLATANEVMTEVMSIPERSIPQDLLNKAECMVIVPGLKKGAFIVGGKFGRGFVTCRNEGNVGWSAPGSVRVEGGSVGFQIGGAETDVIMLIMNRRGAEKMFRSKFTLGGDASVAAGPVGRDTSAQTDAYMNAQILTWSRQRGAFAGISLTGATLRPDRTANKELYGRDYENSDIVAGKVTAPTAAEPLLASLNKYSSRK